MFGASVATSLASESSRDRAEECISTCTNFTLELRATTQALATTARCPMHVAFDSCETVYVVTTSRAVARLLVSNAANARSKSTWGARERLSRKYAFPQTAWNGCADCYGNNLVTDPVAHERGRRAADAS